MERRPWTTRELRIVQRMRTIEGRVIEEIAAAVDRSPRSVRWRCDHENWRLSPDARREVQIRNCAKSPVGRARKLIGVVDCDDQFVCASCGARDPEKPYWLSPGPVCAPCVEAAVRMILTQKNGRCAS
jgi:hypothetical protein